MQPLSVLLGPSASTSPGGWVPAAGLSAVWGHNPTLVFTQSVLVMLNLFPRKLTPLFRLSSTESSLCTEAGRVVGTSWGDAAQGHPRDHPSIWSP